jgi:hypothetical protein
MLSTTPCESSVALLAHESRTDHSLCRAAEDRNVGARYLFDPAQERCLVVIDGHVGHDHGGRTADALDDALSELAARFE